jgi:hypothetical protein
VNAPVPPEAEIVAEPFDPPKHDTLVCADTEEVITAGCMMLTVCWCVQELASVMVTV